MTPRHCSSRATLPDIMLAARSMANWWPAGDKGRFHVVAQLQENIQETLMVAEVGGDEHRETRSAASARL